MDMRERNDKNIENTTINKRYSLKDTILEG